MGSLGMCWGLRKSGTTVLLCVGAFRWWRNAHLPLFLDRHDVDHAYQTWTRRDSYSYPNSCVGVSLSPSR